MYAVLDSATGWLLQLLVVITPWMFGTSGRWEIRLATGLGLALGVLVLAKAWVARREDFEPMRWGQAEASEVEAGEEPTQPRDRWVSVLLGIQVVFLGMVLASLVLPGSLPAAGVGDEGVQAGWRLFPGTYDWKSTVEALGVYLGLVSLFWATRDWLSYRSTADRKELEREREQERETSGAPLASGGSLLIPSRFRRLLWLVCLNGVVLGAVGLLQRMMGSARLAGVISLGAGLTPEAVFGPWPDRSHAAHYFNLLWPVCLVAWLWLQERAGRLQTRTLARFDGPQVILLPVAMMLAVVPVVTGSQPAAVVGLGLLLLVVVLLLGVSRRQVGRKVRWVTLAALILAGGAALGGGWAGFRQRLVRPDHRLVTGMRLEGDPFTLLLRLHPMDPAPGEWVPLVQVRDEVEDPNPSGSMFGVGIGEGGDLVVQLTGAGPQDNNRRTIPRFAGLFGGREVLLGIVRDREIRVYADGNELGGLDGKTGAAPGWFGRTGSRFVRVMSRKVAEVALLDAALDPAALAEAAKVGLSGLGRRFSQLPPWQADGVALTNGLIVPSDTDLSLRPDLENPARKWVRLRRKPEGAPVGFQRPLVGINPGYNGPVGVSFWARNGRNTPVFLEVSMDGGVPSRVEIGTRSDKQVSVACRVPHEGPPRLLEVRVPDPGTGVTADLVLRELRLQPAATLFTRALDPELRLGAVAGRVLAGAESREVARRMAASHPLWGTGAGTFGVVAPRMVEAGDPGSVRGRVHAHGDWLQARATFGWVGVGLLVAGGWVLVVRGWRGPGLPTAGILVGLVWVSLAGCLVTAAFDAPFQSHSVRVLFTLLAGLVSVLGVVSGGRRRGRVRGS